LFHATFGAPDLTTFCNLDKLGLTVTGQHIDARGAVLECRVVDADDSCRACGGRGRPLGTVTRRLAHEPFGGGPPTLVLVLVLVRRYRCTLCARFWLQDTSAAARPRAKVSRDGLAWALRALVVDHRSISRIAAGLAVAWNTANDAVLTEGHRRLINDPTRFDGVAVLDPFHVVRLAGDALDQCRRRIQQQLHGHRGRAGDPLYTSRRTLHTGAGLLTDRQWVRIERLFDTDEHVEIEATWAIYQRMITAYRNPDRSAAGRDLAALIESLRTGVPTVLVELRRLGRTLNARKNDILAFFDRPGTSNGPNEAINGRLEHLCGTALGFRNLSNYITRSILEAGGFRPALHPQL